MYTNIPKINSGINENIKNEIEHILKTAMEHVVFE
jgi:hypothetical protein